MRIAVCSDEAYPVHQILRREIERRGHECVAIGAFEAGPNQSWVEVAEQAALEIVEGRCDEGIFLCWSGTGITMAANKVPGIRAALCFDPATAKAAREWNNANVLSLSNRALSGDVAKEILAAWFDARVCPQAERGVAQMIALDARWRMGR